MLELVSFGRTTKGVASELGISHETVLVSMQSILTKLHPPPLPPAASAALAVPRQRAEDVPTHVGKPLRRGERAATAITLIDCEEDRTLRAVLVGMLREADREAV